MNTIYDTIVWLRSQQTGKRFPVVRFTADTDLATAGWVSLTSLERLEVVVTQMTGDEYEATAKDVSGYLKIEDRVNRELDRGDLRCAWFLRVEETGPSGAGMSFQEFREVYSPPRLFYRDIHSTDGEAEEESTVSRAEFECDGGVVTVIE